MLVSRWLALGLFAAVAGCKGTPSTASTTEQRSEPAVVPAQNRAFNNTPYKKKPSVPVLTALGRSLFFDRALSASGDLACASCHDPDHAYGPPDDRAVAVRAIPSLRYLSTVPRFDEHYHDSDGDDGMDQGPAGGFTWDGRAETPHEQARLPIFSPMEMANEDPAHLIARLRTAPIASALREAFGDDVLDSTEIGMNAVLHALEVFEQSPPEFYPYDSKYDAVIRGQAKLSERERRGLALYNDPKKGNCASCHPSAMKGGAFPQFTDFGFVALGVPRNRKLPSNADPDYHDLGLCGPLRTDLTGHREYCGRFRTPSLRNVTLRRRFMHNGMFGSLEEVLRFYVERDLHPEKLYPRGDDRGVQKFDDLPEPYHANVNRDPPFDRRPGDKPALTEAEMGDIITFLGTLNDGYRP